jgi:NitT/TauT family transport system substrate-binding protein
MRRLFLSLQIHLLTLVILFTVGHAGAASPEVKIAIPSFNLQYLPAVIAEEKGFYKQEDLDVKLILMRGANETILALNGGHIDFIMAIGPAVPLINKGSDIKFLCQQVREVTFALVTKPEIKSVKELVGKSIGVSFGGTTYTGTIAVLSKLGFDTDKDFKYINIRGSTPKLAALQQRVIDAAPLSVPEDIKAVRLGFKRLIYYGETLNNVAFTGLATAGSTIKTKPDIVKKVVRAVVKAVYFTRENRDESIATVIKRFKTDKAMAEESYDLVRKSFLPIPTEEGVRVSAELELGKFEEKVPPSQYMDLHFLNEVLKELKKK